jgi:rRNA maturation endonuclease Nob1
MEIKNMKYEYECKDCFKTVEFVFPLYVPFIGLKHKCPHCGSNNLKRIWNVSQKKYRDCFYNKDNK